MNGASVAQRDISTDGHHHHRRQQNQRSCGAGVEGVQRLVESTGHGGQGGMQQQTAAGHHTQHHGRGRGRGKGHLGLLDQPRVRGGAEAEAGGGDQTSLLEGKREQGFVVSVRESYGFISCVERTGEVFFHVSEMLPSANGELHGRQDLSQLVSEGDEVEFVVVPNPRSDRPNAKAITILPPGTVKTHEKGTGMLEGQVVHECQATGRRASGKDDATGIIRVTGVVEGQKIEESRGPSAAVGETLAFERADVVHGGSPTTGSLVRFIVAYHLRSKQKRAVEVEVTKVAQPVPGAREWDQGKDSRIQKQDLPQAHESQSKPRQMGVVVTVKESFGFIRPVDQVRNDGPQVFFHFSELPEGVRPSVGSAVAYTMQFSQKTKRDVGVNVEILPDGVLPLGPPQTMRGIVNITADGSTGMLLFCDADGIDQTCSYKDEVVSLPDGAGPLQVEDEVEFEAQLNLQKLNYTAAAVRLVRRVSESLEYGQVTMIKNNFGFIKCCSRQTDVFFHLATLKGELTADNIAVGANVQFHVIRDKNSGKQNAVNVSPAPEGAVVFETVDEQELQGQVLERSFAKGAQGSGGMAGVIEFLQADEAAQRITFLAADVVGANPKAGDLVSFKIATNLRAERQAMRSPNPKMATLGARRAVQVAVTRHIGTVAAVRGSFGFIEYQVSPVQVIDDEAVDPSRKRNDAKDYMAVPAMTDVAAAVVESDAADSSVDRSGDEAVTADAGCISLPADTDPDASDAPPRNICVGDEISGKGIIAAQDVEPIRAEQAESKPDSGTAPREIASTASGTADAKAAASKQEMYSSPEAVTGASEASGSVQLEGAGDIAAMVKEPDDPIAGKRNKAASRSKHRVFFHFSEVEDGIALGQGDQVEFSTAMNPKTKELNARRIVRVKEAVHRPEKYKKRPDEELVMAERKPLRLGAPPKQQTVYQPHMPDGTRGFSFGRGKGLEGIEHPPLGLRPPPPPEPEPEPELPAPRNESPARSKARQKKPKAGKGPGAASAAAAAVPEVVEVLGRQDSSSSLNANAPPFVPPFGF